MRIRNTEDYKKYLALLAAGCPVPGGDHAVEDQEYQELLDVDPQEEDR